MRCDSSARSCCGSIKYINIYYRQNTTMDLLNLNLKYKICITYCDVIFIHILYCHSPCIFVLFQTVSYHSDAEVAQKGT
jgi:hypothetical protein